MIIVNWLIWLFQQRWSILLQSFLLLFHSFLFQNPNNSRFNEFMSIWTLTCESLRCKNTNGIVSEIYFMFWRTKHRQDSDTFQLFKDIIFSFDVKTTWFTFFCFSFLMFLSFYYQIMHLRKENLQFSLQLSCF